MTVKRRTISLILRFVKHVIMGDNTNLYDLRELDKREFVGMLPIREYMISPHIPA